MRRASCVEFLNTTGEWNGGQQEEARRRRSRADRLGERYEVAYWSKKFKVTPAKLKAAVAAAGHSSKKVGEYLARKKAPKKTAAKKKKSAKRKKA
jgi:Protein of unknown function (DUF3606)